MRDRLRELLDAVAMGICLRNSAGQVVYQNRACITCCGRREGRICRDGCMALVRPPFKGREVFGKHFDVTLLQAGREAAVTLLEPLESRRAELLASLDRLPLTELERQVTQMILQGATNGEIRRGLAISKGTLKKCLERIRQKLGQPLRREAA